jgi:hypothetical protein
MSCNTKLNTYPDNNTDKQTDLIILDFSKAFDKVPHKKLLRKLDNYGIRRNIWNWISAFLNNGQPGKSLMNTRKSSDPRIDP